ncbi:unnamed protein product [Sphagnum balticum]
MAARSSTTILAAGLSIFVGASILVLLAELYYLLCWRRRVLLANPRVSQEISSPTAVQLVVEDAVVSCSSVTQTATSPSNCSNNLDIMSVGYKQEDQLELVKKKLFPNLLAATAAAVKVTTTHMDTSLKSVSQVSSLSINPDMSQQQQHQLNTLMGGQPHVLFTIKEEEDLETGIMSDHHPKKKKSKWKAIISKSMESVMTGTIVRAAPDHTSAAAFVTPPSPPAPYHNTPATTCSLQVNRWPLQILISNLGLRDKSSSPWIHGDVCALDNNLEGSSVSANLSS